MAVALNASQVPFSFAAEIHNRHVRLALDASRLTAMQAGGLDIVELLTGFSETFKRVQLTDVDALLSDVLVLGPKPRHEV